MKHSPLPWAIDKNHFEFSIPRGNIVRVISTSPGPDLPYTVAHLDGLYEVSKYNSEFIVKACNMHHDLIEALEEAHEILLSDYKEELLIVVKIKELLEKAKEV